MEAILSRTLIYAIRVGQRHKVSFNYNTFKCNNITLLIISCNYNVIKCVIFKCYNITLFIISCDYRVIKCSYSTLIIIFGE